MASSSEKTNAPKRFDGLPFGDWVEFLLFTGATAVIFGVGLYFSLSVNRVFDVPKSFAIKFGGSAILLIWIIRATFGRGTRWKPLKLFGAPVAALLTVGILSTITSLDPTTSLYGVYERQFGLQGFLGCVGLFVITATCIRSKRGAVLGLALLGLVGGLIGSYSVLQSFGIDPFGFFKKPHNKVYSFLGNATFAGNALALVFPTTTLLAIAAIGTVTSRAHAAGAGLSRFGTVLGGFALMLGLQILLPAVTRVEFGLLMGYWASGALLLGAAAMGSYGIGGLKLPQESSQRNMDGIAAGALAAQPVAILCGLAFTRTRGAWVGTGVAIVLGLLLLPRLFKDKPDLQRTVRNTCLALLVGGGLASTIFVLTSEHLFARTIRSIPAAFDPNRTDFGKGQGTRRFLWTESPRVLTNHGATLARLKTDHDLYAEHVDHALLGDLPIPKKAKIEDDGSSVGRRVTVWLLGIGVETYRYAFMSHKSKRLEALDPMTNHDNPHNNYLYTLASFGILGLLAYLWLLWRLLRQSFRRFVGAPAALLNRGSAGLEPGVITAWDIVENEKKKTKRLYLTTSAPDAVAGRLLTLPGIEIKDGAQADRVVVTGERVGAALLEEIAGLPPVITSSRSERAIAFGIVTSFFSYSVYSIAGFDSVACSVFLYFLLGCAASLFEADPSEPYRPLPQQLKRHFLAFRGKDPSGSGGPLPVVPMVVALALTPLLLHTCYSAYRLYRAEQAFVGSRTRPRSRIEALQRQVDHAKAAIEINNHESFYKQKLGSAYGDLARGLRQQARQQRQQGNMQQVAALVEQAKKNDARGESALYAALDHAWAPENIFISLFQIYYGSGRTKEAELALEHALLHSPHLGAVRANLAAIKAERGAYQAALTDCKWVLDVDPRSAIAHRTCGKAQMELGDLEAAAMHLDRAGKRRPDDPVIARLKAELEAKRNPPPPPPPAPPSSPSPTAPPPPTQ